MDKGLGRKAASQFRSMHDVNSTQGRSTVKYDYRTGEDLKNALIISIEGCEAI